MKKQAVKAVKKIAVYAALIVCASCLGAAGTKEKHMQKNSFSTISAQEAKARMDKGGVIIVDVRTQAEYDSGHIPGAIVIPNETIGSSRPAQLPDLNAEILVYCRSGARSRNAAGKLAALGYTAIYDFGGIISWPYEVVK
ncbi:rhodanese-like domain-containing protein [Treponema sp. OMZ 840]|uniref:rhodanese-like domain-containing protein n=1 Tax=Treponema sp. OMZ 840 TaxID=244313 RepID=UPI003D89E6E2